MGFSRQAHWSGLLFSPPGDLPNPGIKSTSPALTGTFFPTESPEKPGVCSYLQPKAFSLTCTQYKWELWGLQELRNWPKIPQVVDWDLSPDHLAPDPHPSPIRGDAYLFGLQIKSLVQMRIKLSTAQERIKIPVPQETQSVQYWTYSRWLLKELETHTLFQPWLDVHLFPKVQQLDCLHTPASSCPSKKSPGFQTLATALLFLAAFLDNPVHSLAPPIVACLSSHTGFKDLEVIYCYYLHNSQRDLAKVRSESRHSLA